MEQDMNYPAIDSDANIALLQKIYANAKTGADATGFAIGKARGEKLRETLKLELEGYENYLNESARLLRAAKTEPKPNGIMSRAGLWLSFHANTLADASNRKIAEMLTESAMTGINDMIESIYDHQDAEEPAKHLAARLMQLREKYINSMKYFLTH